MTGRVTGYYTRFARVGFAGRVTYCSARFAPVRFIASVTECVSHIEIGAVGVVKVLVMNGADSASGTVGDSAGSDIDVERYKELAGDGG